MYQLKIGNWTVNCSPEKIVLSKEHENQCGTIINNWAEHFPREQTWVQNKFGIPTLMARIDFCIKDDGEIGLYEIEDEPAGIGISRAINSQFLQTHQSLLKVWPYFEVIISPSWKGNDDVLWRKIIELSSWKSPQLVWVKAHPIEREFHVLEEYSVTTLKLKGVKSYGVGMGLWDKVFSSDFESLSWNEGFVLKPLQGCRSQKIEIWNPNSGKLAGQSTKSQIKKTLEGQKEMYLQKLMIPGRRKNIPGYILYRCYWGYDTVSRKWLSLGGVWVARENLRIHGASDSLIGAIELEL